ncbi:hypothetical protein G6N76_11040 [Rhizobium daejeonense]|uniref:Uncharacterized protein n=1 Tax=Rhizobium daejeonense TaxID=240521 RepID=A0A6M1RZR0_9HYPH|nr:primase-helicase zinc-binding domain-containing protein [Rhizobium daejeonense]NGO64213.1 hypothetical protein [Rhizobium daejeonense]
MNAAIEEFVINARAVDFDVAADRLNVPDAPKGKPEYQGPCPRCGGNDRFAVNRKKGVWVCRGADGGRDGIGLAAHLLHLDLRRREEFLEACAAVLGEEVPEGAERESDEEREARLKRIAEAKAKADTNRQDKEKKQADFREKEVGKARGIYLNAVDCRRDEPDALEGARVISSYLQARTGFVPAGGVFENLRFIPRCTYWHGQDDFGRPLALHEGWAMIAPFVNTEGRIIGCHQTWIDLSQLPKRRPVLLDADGAALPTKKMRGTKKGGFIPVYGDPSAKRWMGGEGIETLCAVAAPEGWRDDTFYFAAGDIGNLAGPADPKSAFNHPTLKKEDAAGRLRAIRVQGPVPRTDSDAGDVLHVPEHVSELVLLADGDSEPVATASAMARAEARHAREGRQVSTWWPPEGQDFAEAMAEAMGGGHVRG